MLFEPGLGLPPRGCLALGFVIGLLVWDGGGLFGWVFAFVPKKFEKSLLLEGWGCGWGLDFGVVWIGVCWLLGTFLGTFWGFVLLEGATVGLWDGLLERERN